MSRFTDQEEKYMRKALELAAKARGQTSPNPMVGCVIVKNHRIIGRGHHQRAGGAHAEVAALKAVKADPRGAAMYVNLEPCHHQGQTPPCVKAIVDAGIAEVVVAMYDPNPLVTQRGVRALRQAGVKVRVGLLQATAQRLNEAFVTYHTLKRPFVIVKWAITLDGRTASDTGSSEWISNATSRIRVHEIRSHVDAIMVGIGTVIKDNPRLNVRLPNYQGRHPYRVIIDGHLKIPTRCNCLMLDKGGPAILVTTSNVSNEKRIRALREFGHTVYVVRGRRGIVRLEDALKKLHQHNVLSVFVEGGQQIHTSLLERGLVDKVVCFVAPKIIGGRLKHPIEGWGMQEMSHALELEDTEIRTFENDVCIEGYIKREKKAKSEKSKAES